MHLSIGIYCAVLLRFIMIPPRVSFFPERWFLKKFRMRCRALPLLTRFRVIKIKNKVEIRRKWEKATSHNIIKKLYNKILHYFWRAFHIKIQISVRCLINPMMKKNLVKRKKNKKRERWKRDTRRQTFVKGRIVARSEKTRVHPKNYPLEKNTPRRLEFLARTRTWLTTFREDNSEISVEWAGARVAIGCIRTRIHNPIDGSRETNWVNETHNWFRRQFETRN